MTTRVVWMTPAPDLGDTLLHGGRPAVVIHLLPERARRPNACRVAFDPPCRACKGGPLRYDALRRGWECRSCRNRPERAALAAWAREHVADGVRAGRNRRTGARQSRQVAKGAPGAAAVLLAAARDGGAPSGAFLEVAP